MLLLVIGILQAGDNWALFGDPPRPRARNPALVLPAQSAREERRGQGATPVHEPCSAAATSNLGLVTQNMQWLLLLGGTFVVSVFLQVSAATARSRPGVIFTAATGGILASSLAAQRLARSAFPSGP